MARAKSTGAWDSINPYISWALGPGRNQYFIPGRQTPGKERMPLVLQLKGRNAREFLDGGFIDGTEPRGRWRDSFQILSGDAQHGGDGRSAVWVSAMAPAELVERIPPFILRRHVDSASLGRPLDTQALPAPRQRPRATTRLPIEVRSATTLSASTTLPVVMGIIDDGIAFAHERFRKHAGGAIDTRVEHWWLQDGPFAPPYFPFLPAPSQTVPFGCELDRSQINSLMAGGVSAIDEEVVYRQARLLDFSKLVVSPQVDHQSVAWHVAHGTHVMDLACGFDPDEQVDDRPIVCVQLPTRVTADEFPGDLYFYAQEAINYIVARAQEIAVARGFATLPVVINLSYGLLADPHDGTGFLEAFIDDKIQECKNNGFDLRVVLPSGNSYLSRTHAQVSFTSVGQTQKLWWRVLPDGRAPSFLEIWLPPPAPTTTSRLTLTIISPTGASWTIKETLPPFIVNFGSPPFYGRVTHHVWPPSNRTRFIVMLQPTAQPDPNGPIPLLAPAGTWEIEMEHTGGLTSAVKDLVHAWVRRDDQVYGFPLRGRQSFLDDPRYRRFDHAGRDEEYDNAVSLVRRESTTNSIASGTLAIVMGGYLGKERVPAKYSAAGARTGMPALPPPPLPPPPFPTAPRWPDAMTVSEDSRVHAGVLAAGSRSGSVIAMGGTSVAAPQIARRVADDLAGGGSGERLTVENLAVAGLSLPQPERSGEGGIPADPIVKLKRYEWP